MIVSGAAVPGLLVVLLLLEEDALVAICGLHDVGGEVLAGYAGGVVDAAVREAVVVDDVPVVAGPLPPPRGLDSVVVLGELLLEVGLGTWRLLLGLLNDDLAGQYVAERLFNLYIKLVL